jgi:hypothetical protein
LADWRCQYLSFLQTAPVSCYNPASVNVFWVGSLLQLRVSKEQDQLEIVVDAERFTVAGRTMSGSQIKALARKDLQHQLFLEGPGDRPDRRVKEEDSVQLRSGMRFYTVPPAVFGL